MTIPRSPSLHSRLAVTLALIGMVCAPAALEAQGASRIWGRVGTVGGAVYEGFIRWDRNEADWVDLLNGSKAQEWEPVVEWVPDSTLRVTSRDRVIEYGGYRITWDDDEADFPETAESGIRFGHVRRIEVTGDQEVLVELKAKEGETTVTMNEDPVVTHPEPGVTTIMNGGSTDLGDDLRELLVEVPGGEVVELGWEDLAWVELGPAPEGAIPRARRLFGTVEDHRRNRYTGAISWDNDEALTTDTLDGYDEDDRDRDILFGRIASVRPRGGGAEVTLVDGSELFLSGTNDVDDDNRGIQISDPGLGQVDVDWNRLESVDFHDPDPASLALMDYSAFDGGHPLRGTVTTISGDELTGLIRWDADEEASWEILDSYERGVTMDIELGNVLSIEKVKERDVMVTLGDGRVLEVGGSNDVDSDNKGILVRTQEMEASEDPEAPRWIRVRWDDFVMVQFEQGGGR